MSLVKAKCVTAAWDSNASFRFDPGCGPFDGLYEINSDGPLAELKLGGKYVFEFDRGVEIPTTRVVNDSGTDNSAESKARYQAKLDERTCRVCSPKRVFKDLRAYRLHVTKAHKKQEEEAAATEAA